MDFYFRYIFDVVNAIQFLAVAISLVIIFFPKDYSIKKWYWTLLSLAIAYGLCFVMTAGLTSLAFAVRNVVVSDLSFTFSYLIAFVIIFFFVRRRPSIKIVLLATYLAFIVIVIEFGAQLMRMIQYYTDGQYNLDFISILSYILIIICAVIMRRFSLMKFDSVSSVNFILIYIVDALCIVAVRTYTIYASLSSLPVTNYFVLVTFGILYFIVLFTYLLTYKVVEEHNQIVFLSQENLAIAMDKKMMKISQQSYDDIREIKHDIKNQLMSLGYLVKEKKYDELEEYYKELMNSVEFSLYRIDTGNEAFNAVINLENSKARFQKIKFNNNLVIPKETPFSPSDICSLISNACDNAIEYLSKAEIENKEMDLNIVPRGDYLYIGVKNPLVDNVNTVTLKTTKTDSGDHGHGHIIINKIAEKYNGYALFSADEGCFICEIMLDLKCAKGKN